MGTCALAMKQPGCFSIHSIAYGLDFNVDPPAPVLENNLPPNADHCKTTLCDASGDVLFLCTGIEVLNCIDVMPTEVNSCNTQPLRLHDRA